MYFLVTTFRTPAFNPEFIAPHYAFLDRLRSTGLLKLAGPFADKSGGAYLLEAESIDDAKKIAYSDPLHTSLSSVVTVHEWQAK